MIKLDEIEKLKAQLGNEIAKASPNESLIKRISIKIANLGIGFNPIFDNAKKNQPY